MLHNQDDRAGRGVDISIETTQESRDCDLLRVAPEKKAWLPPVRVLDRLCDTVSDRYRISIFDSSMLHGLDSSASDFCTEHEFYFDVFFKHRWYNRNHKRDGASLIQAWKSFIHNFGEIGRDVWLDKMTLSRNGFEKRTSSGARYKLHRLSREAGLPCFSWGDACQSCVNILARAPKEAYSMNEPWWKVSVTQEMYEGIANLQFLYKRAGRSFHDGPSSASDAPCRTARQGPKTSTSS